MLIGAGLSKLRLRKDQRKIAYVCWKRMRFSQSNEVYTKNNDIYFSRVPADNGIRPTGLISN